jgi:hypothetical protein
MNIEHWPRLPRFVWAMWFIALAGVGIGSGMGMSDGLTFALVLVLSLFAAIFWGIPQSLR